ncbi:uncharacterized protein EV422DRAFT_161196 [Fimicolochytrium jonesii]|uniref:uncharacterized protein n=1 Tax=Fimicolochytrium jonesii TaxID=1396493 RepID=UPI0022FE790E|nr:uncharacterized protein EV422DRAFT_161196 [Fimicolochytrium jonesii]KAI8826293.1 hypothetical protein EV422DRAFT_161196 [Fimicolochytrium jonesii]
MQFWSSIVVFYTLHVVTVYAAKCDNGTVDATVLMLIGSTGVGKSTTANRIYELKSTWSMEKKSHVFAEGDTAKACTNETQMEVFKTAQGCLRLIDTPGVQATDMPEGVIMTDIAHTMLSLQYGVNAFIFVMRGTNNKLDIGLQKGLDRYTKALGKEFWKNAIVFFNQKESSGLDSVAHGRECSIRDR